MKKTVKSFVAIIMVVLLLILSLTACGSATLEDAKDIFDKYSVWYTEKDGRLSAVVAMYNGTKYTYENKDVISELEETFDIPSYNELLKMHSSRTIKCGKLDIEIEVLTSGNNSKVLTISFEEG